MDSSRRAVESYWRSKMIDGVTTDEDKVAPVYKLEEICELLRSSHAGIVKEVSEFILKRLGHKSPIVKQKALRLIKYSVGKSGVEFKREMQRHSAVIRQLFHYKGHLDPLKGDALNKAVRDIAHEAMLAVFSSEDNKPAPSEDISRRIQGFGNTNFEVQTDDNKSFLSEVVGLGSASIRQGLNTFTAAHSLGKNDNGTYKSPNLRRSLTIEAGSPDSNEREEQSRGSWNTYETSRNVGAGPWVQDSRATATEMMNGDTGSGHTGVKSREERLLETIVSSGGVRLQPTRDALQIFLVEASKLDPLALSHALESKLNSHLWQVHMKAVCVLESILRKKDDAIFSTVASYFSENIDVIIKCSESPQSSLREKANKVLSLLDGEKIAGANTLAGKSSTANAQTDVQMPDLIDTNYQDDYGNEDSTHKQMDQSTPNPTAASPVVDDLFGGSTTPSKKEHDPFADVSFHTIDDKGHSDDIFSGLTVDDKQASIDLNTQTNKCGPELFDVFSSYCMQPTQETTSHKRDVNDLMADLSINAMAPEQRKQPGNIGGPFSEITFSDLSNQSTNSAQNEVLNSVFHSPTVGGVSPSNPTSLFPLDPIQYSIPPNFMFNQGLSSQCINYSAMASLIAQQQLLATMNFQHLGNLGASGNSGLGHAAGIGMEGGNSAFPDIFQLTNNPITSISTAANASKNEETKAFDFISDHLSAARDMKRVV